MHNLSDRSPFEVKVPLSFMPYDIYERHQVVSVLLRDRSVENVLDVGGNLGVFEKFAKTDVVTLNIDGSGDVQYDGHAIPFSDERFDTVITLDTLEHIPKEHRLAFLRECLRVTRCYLVVAAPFGSQEHKDYERRLDALYTTTYGIVHPYLNQHVRYGIPGDEEIHQLVRELGLTAFQIYFAGDFVWQCKNFERALVSQGRRLPQLYNRLSSMALFHPIRLTIKLYAHANRFYLFAEKKSAAC